MSNLLTNSRMKAFRRCQQFHHIRYLLGYSPVKTDEDMFFGSLIHTGLEAMMRGQDYLAAIHAEKADPFDMARAEVMLEAYEARWGNDLEVLGVEVPFECELRNPESGRSSQTFRLAGMIDAIVRVDGKVLIMEHKTSSSDVGPGSDYWKRLKLDSQISVYYEGARSLGHEVEGALYDVLKKPGQRPLQVNSKRATPETPIEYKSRIITAMLENPDGYFQRGEVVRLEDEMRLALGDTWQQAKQMLEAENAERHPRNPDACVMFGKTCPYFGVCTGEQSLDNPEHFTQSTDVHPELSDAKSS